MSDKITNPVKIVVRDFSHRTRKIVIAISIIVVVVAVVVGLYETGKYIYNDYKKHHKPKVVTVVDNTNKINKDIAAKNFQGAINVLKSQPQQLEQSESQQILLASYYLNNNQAQQALTVYQNAIKQFGINAQLAQGAAQAALSAQSYQNAIYYYQQAATIAKNDKSDPQSTYNYNLYTQEANTLVKEHPND